MAPDRTIDLTSGEHGDLIKAVIEECASRFAPGSTLVYAGDAGEKWSYCDEHLLRELGVDLVSTAKMPDVVLHFASRDWLILVECATDQGLMDGKRHAELATEFKDAKPGLVYVTAFPSRAFLARYITEIAWETEVWVADAPSHLIHFNGDRFLGPYATE